MVVPLAGKMFGKPKGRRIFAANGEYSGKNLVHHGMFAWDWI
jgi:hypothetical protein